MSCRTALVCLVLAILLWPLQAWAQGQSLSEPLSISGTVRYEDGHPSVGATAVELKQFTGQVVATAVTDGTGSFRFEGLMPGNYIVVVQQAGFEPAQESLNLANFPLRGIQLYLKKPAADVSLSYDPGSVVTSSHTTVPRNASKNFQKGIERLNRKDAAGSLPHFQKAIAHFPGYYEAYYAMAIAQSTLGHVPEEEQALRKCIELSGGRYVDAEVALGALLSSEKKFAEAENVVRQGLAVDPHSWRGHYELARALFGLSRADEAEASALEALQGGSDFAPLYLLLGNIHLQKHDYGALKQDMETYLKLDSNGPASDQARRILTAIVAAPAKSQTAPPASPGQLPQSAALASPAPTPTIASVNSRPWPPPELMEAKLLAGAHPPCSLNQVLPSVSQNVKQLADALQSITATETIEHRRVDKDGTVGPPRTATFNYLFSLTQISTGNLSVEEMRNGSLGLENFPTRTATTGLPAIALIFHPFYIADYDTTCEGMTQWRGKPAWLVRFEQRKGVPGRIHSLRVNGLWFPVSLKGRAWIAASNYQILRLVTELAEPIPQIRLQADSLAVEYQPVQFRAKGKQLWLPAAAEAYLDLLDHRYYQRHTFTHYMLFAVDTTQKIENPREQP